MEPTGRCLDCGEPATGLRCRKHHGVELLKRTLRETAENDREILRLRDTDKLSYGRIGTRYGVSKTRARNKVIEARRREKVREQMGSYL